MTDPNEAEVYFTAKALLQAVAFFIFGLVSFVVVLG